MLTRFFINVGCVILQYPLREKVIFLLISNNYNIIKNY